MKVPLTSQRPPAVFVRMRGKRGSVETLGVLDTGATTMLIPSAIADHLGYELNDAPLFHVVTVNGVVEVPKIILREVGIGSARRRNVAAVCHDMPHSGAPVLIGLSFLQHFRVTLDFPGSCLLLEEG